MKNLINSSSRLLAAALVFAVLIMGPLAAKARVVDNFDDNTKTDWKDFTFVPGFGIPKEAGGQMQFELPPAGQAIFTATQKTSEQVTLQEGRTVEMRVDVIQGGGKDSFAVLAFIPTANSPGTLAGYGLAKSTTDVLLTKGIGKYFVADAGAPAQIKMDNVTLVLTLIARNGAVEITGKVLDKANNDAVLWQKTVVDTAGADVLADGEDNPAAPYLTAGYFTLYCYEDFDSAAPEDPYRVYYDNAEIFITDTAVLDNFDDNTKSDWKDFTFVPGFGLPTETSGQFRFVQPPAGQAIFTGSQKTSQTFQLTEGERLEFRVDIEEGGGKDSFAILSFTPVANSPSTLSGYGFAKSTTDVLLTKGIGKYFVAADGPEAQLKNEKITLVLSLTVRNGAVTFTGKVLDRENNNAVIWERTVVDSPGADVLADGQDSPAAPYLGAGYFTLFCYQDFDRNAPEDPYKIYYDNAIVSAPPAAANVPPQIVEVTPAEFASFVAATSEVSFKLADDKVISDDKILVKLNEANLTVGNGLTVTASGNTKTVKLGGLAANVNYALTITVTDSDGETVSRTVYFDTFASSSLMVEIEDYNFGGGRFINNPAVVAEGSSAENAYSLQVGVPGVDFNDTRTTPRVQDTMYRPEDPVRMQRSRDNLRAKYGAAGGTAAGVYDYDVGDIAEGEWFNYTRTFPAGTYEVYLRQALVNMVSGESVLELVEGDRTQPNQTTRVLGSFLGQRTGFQYRNFALTDGTGKTKTIVRLSGESTLRLRQVTPDAPDATRYQTYLIFIPVADPGLQRASIASISPPADSTVETVTPVIRAEIRNRDTTVKADTIRLEVNGQVVVPGVTSDANGSVVTYTMAQLPASGATNTAMLEFKDNTDTAISTRWSFVVTYKSLLAANRRAGPGLGRGLQVLVVQAPQGSSLANDLQRAEDQLAPNSSIPVAMKTNVVEQVINQSQDDRVTGFFPGETLVPGLEGDVNGTDDFAVEITGWLELQAGVHRFGVVTDDGYKVSSGAAPKDKEPVLAYHNGGPANETFDFVAPAAGFYPFRMMWYERGGNAYAEWFSVDAATGDRILINDPDNPKAIKAFLEVESGPSIVVQSAAEVTGPYAAETAAVVNAEAKTIRLRGGQGMRFYRLQMPGAAAGTRLRISTLKLEGADIVLSYEVQ